MGWFPVELENTLQEALTEDFYKNLFNHCKAAAQEGDWSRIPDSFTEFRWRNEDATFEDFMDDIDFMAFCDDHMEHVGAWLYDKSVWSLFKKHKINGRYVLSHETGDGGYSGIEFVDGEPYDVEVKIATTLTRGVKLG